MMLLEHIGLCWIVSKPIIGGQRLNVILRKSLGRGENAAIKDRLEEMCKYLKEVAVTSRMIWKSAKEDLKTKDVY